MIEELTAKPDLIILDPPRDSVNPRALEKIINFGCNKIIYVSCKPTSLVRDLQVLQESGYKVEKVKCMDMFPGTWHPGNMTIDIPDYSRWLVPTHVETIIMMTNSGKGKK